MIQSFSAKGHPYDNAVMECFFKYLKKEELNRRHFQSVEQLKQSLVSTLPDFITLSDLTLTTMAFLLIIWKTAILLISLVHFIDYSPDTVVSQ